MLRISQNKDKKYDYVQEDGKTISFGQKGYE